jgi:uncharacterized integral membrane protein
MNRRQDGDPNDTRSPLRTWGPPALLLVAGILFVTQNTEEVRFDFFTFSFNFPLWLVLVAFTALGAFIGWWLRRDK